MSGHDLILGTAGHIDHGKTALVKALTGIDTDRLEEEKRRGISIDIGFAHLDLGGRRLGVVDVPGHERFVRNMLAGASGIDIGLLVVAADDSVMPQTREHLSILRLLQVPAGMVVITKCDLADESWLALVEEDVRALVAGTFLEGAPVVRTSVVSGVGLDELKQVLSRLCASVQPRRAADFFRMHVDRSFALSGRGTVLTGTVWSGAVSAGDEIECLPAGRRLRVRAAQSHGKDAQSVRQGQRAALNVSGARHDEIGRGDVVASPGFLRAARVLTVRLHALAESPWPIRHRATVRLHIGTQEVMARVRLLEGTLLEPGQSTYAQLHAEAPLVAGGRQPLVVRCQSPLRTLGGGIVLETSARPISRRDRQTIERLGVLDGGDERARAGEVAFLARLDGVSEIDLCRELDLATERAGALLGELERQGTVCAIILGPARVRRVHGERLEEVRRRIVEALERLHKASPLETAVSRQRLAQRLGHLDPEIVMAVADRMIGEGALAGDEHALALPGFAPRLTAAQERLRSEVIEAYRLAAFSPPEPAELARRSGVSDEALRPVLELCVGQHHLAHLGGGLYLHRDREEELRRTMRAALAGGAALTVAEIRDMLGTSRKYAVPFCEYLDRIGLTRRLDDRRVLKDAGGADRSR